MKLFWFIWPLKIFFCLSCTWVRLCVAFRRQSDRNITVRVHLNDLFTLNSTRAEISARVSQSGLRFQPGLKFPSCNRSLYFTGILFFGRADISARAENSPCNHPLIGLRPISTQENFPWTDNFSLSCELPCTTNRFKTKEIFLSKEHFPEWKRALAIFRPLPVRVTHNKQQMYQKNRTT